MNRLSTAHFGLYPAAIAYLLADIACLENRVWQRSAGRDSAHEKALMRSL